MPPRTMDPVFASWENEEVSQYLITVSAQFHMSLDPLVKDIKRTYRLTKQIHQIQSEHIQSIQLTIRDNWFILNQDQSLLQYFKKLRKIYKTRFEELSKNHRYLTIYLPQLKRELRAIKLTGSNLRLLPSIPNNTLHLNAYKQYVERRIHAIYVRLLTILLHGNQLLNRFSRDQFRKLAKKIISRMREIVRENQ